jgi:hypothetical protein
MKKQQITSFPNRLFLGTTTRDHQQTSRHSAAANGLDSFIVEMRRNSESLLSVVDRGDSRVSSSSPSGHGTAYILYIIKEVEALLDDETSDNGNSTTWDQSSGIDSPL